MDINGKEVYFQLRHLTGTVKHEVIVGEIEDEIYKGTIYRVYFPKRKSTVSKHGRLYLKEKKIVYTASAKLESRDNSDILTLLEPLQKAKQSPLIDIYKLITALVIPFSSHPQYEVELKIEKYNLDLYSASLTSDEYVVFKGDYLDCNGLQLEVVDVYDRNLKLREVC